MHRRAKTPLPCLLSSDLGHFLCILQDHYLVQDTNEKSKMLNEYYKKLVSVYFGDGRDSSFFLSEFWNFSEIYTLASF